MELYNIEQAIINRIAFCVECIDGSKPSEDYFNLSGTACNLADTLLSLQEYIDAKNGVKHESTQKK